MSTIYCHTKLIIDSKFCVDFSFPGNGNAKKMKWKCFLKVVPKATVIVTLLPASIEDLLVSYRILLTLLQLGIFSQLFGKG